MSTGGGSTWFRRYELAAPPRARLLCLPHAGGSASFFHSWGHAFGDDVEVLVARYPGRQERIAEPLLESMDELADAVTEELLPFLDIPLVVFGHSMGASLAYEVALRLQELHGVRIAGLYVSCQVPPQLKKPKTAYLGGDAEVIDEVRRLGGTDRALLDDPDLRDLVLPAIRADFRIVGGYGLRPGVPLRCPVAGYLGGEDPDITEAEMEAWSEVAPAGFELRVMPGDHFYLVQQRDALIDDLTRRLSRIR
ncbi:thioesterase [Streptomyces sp. M2CJ-2]|uniref:thioesterase II family protein n=1 Tax=Streptomyces sp. M2CJ-2 TaxID=2803948 RepID=UPI0019280F33|nr:alpha/beta fold hydrolase [Streptomyces sp. M2CJ-2]MBL3669483.1 thioesterase [Streptomyces sp. M2CJ-2]